MRFARRLLAALAICWTVFAGVMYALMTGPPMKFAAAVAKIPSPAMMLLPFPPMWNRARAGALNPGDRAPDFELDRADHSGSVRLSRFQGSKPVVLVFGSYT